MCVLACGDSMEHFVKPPFRLFCRDFGTHVVVSVEAGAVVAKIDSLTSSSRKMSTEDQQKLKIGAATSFAGIFGVNTSSKFEDSDKMVSSVVNGTVLVKLNIL